MGGRTIADWYTRKNKERELENRKKEDLNKMKGRIDNLRI